MPERRPDRWIGLALLAVVTLFNVYYLAPERRIERVPLNDVVFHLAASERLQTSFARSEPFLDPWVSEWSLGYPVWRSYQPIPHVVAAVALTVFGRVSDPAAIFATLYYVLLVTFPLSVYAGARLFGLSSAAAGLASLLALGSSATDLLGSYGLGFGSITWRGSGLYTQLFALHLLVIGLGLGARAIDHGGRTRLLGAALVLAATALSHIVFGYAAFVSVALLAVIGPRHTAGVRLVRLLTIAVPALLLLAWFVVPLVQSSALVNHSRWEDPRKWDSYGARFILTELLAGRLLDFGRWPSLSLLVAVGTLAAIVRARHDVRAQRLLGLCGCWLVLFFGRETWGSLMLLAGVPADFHLHRLQAVFELTAVLLGAFGTVETLRWMLVRTPLLAGAGCATLAAAVISIGLDRSGLSQTERSVGR